MKRTININPANTLIHQYEFAFADPAISPFPAIVGGYRSGKTWSIPLRWTALIDYRADHGDKCELFVVESTYPMVRRVAVPTFNAFFDKYGIKHAYHKTEHTYSIFYKQKRHDCMFVTGERPEAIIGFSKTDGIIDEFDTLRTEDAQEDVYDRCLARLSECENASLGVVTTPEGFRMTYEMYQNENRDPLRYKLIRAKTTDNRFLPASYIQQLYEKYDAKLVQRYVNAEFVNLSGMMAYYMFKREAHVQPCPVNPALPLYIGIDFNVNPMTAVVLQSEGNLYRVVGEYFIPNSNTRALANLIAQDWPGFVIYACPDMTGGSRKTSADYTDIDILKQHGFQVLGTRNIAERSRLNIVNNLFDKTRLLIDPKCKKLINDMEKVVTDSYGQISKEKDSQLTHISDALGYAAVALENKPGKWGIR